MVTVIIIGFFPCVLSEKLETTFCSQYISTQDEDDRKSAKKFPPRRPRRGTRRFGALRLSAASYQMRTLSSPPLTTSLPPHTQSAFLTHIPFVVLPNVPQIAVTFQMPSNDPSVRKPFIPYYICLELVLLSSVFWVML